MPENVLLMDTKIAVVGGSSLSCDKALQGLFESQGLFLTENQLLMCLRPNLGRNPFGNFAVHRPSGPYDIDVIDLELDIPELRIRPFDQSHEPTSKPTLQSSLPEDNGCKD